MILLKIVGNQPLRCEIFGPNGSQMEIIFGPNGSQMERDCLRKKLTKGASEPIGASFDGFLNLFHQLD